MALTRRQKVEVKFDEETLDKINKMVSELDLRLARLTDLVSKADAVAEKARKATADLNASLDRVSRTPFSGKRTW